jgi:hypothetical protein
LLSLGLHRATESFHSKSSSKRLLPNRLRENSIPNKY